MFCVVIQFRRFVKPSGWKRTCVCVCVEGENTLVGGRGNSNLPLFWQEEEEGVIDTELSNLMLREKAILEDMF